MKNCEKRHFRSDVFFGGRRADFVFEGKRRADFFRRVGRGGGAVAAAAAGCPSVRRSSSYPEGGGGHDAAAALLLGPAAPDSLLVDQAEKLLSRPRAPGCSRRAGAMRGGPEVATTKSKIATPGAAVEEQQAEYDDEYF